MTRSEQNITCTQLKIINFSFKVHCTVKDLKGGRVGGIKNRSM